MSARKWRVGAGLAAAVLCVALAACGPADTGAAGLQSVAARSAAATASSTPSGTPPRTTRAAVAPDPASTSAKPSPAAPRPTRTSTPNAKPTPPKPAPPKPVRAATTVTGSVGGSPIRYGDQSAFTIAVRSPAAGSDLTGHVTVRDGTAMVVEGDTDATGNATLGFLNTADPGHRTYTIAYGGNPKATASTVDLPVQTTQTNVDITIDWPEDVTAGKDVTISADVVGTPQTPTGRATITVDGAPISSAAITGDGSITGTAKAVPAGDHAVEVSYAGDVRFQSNTAGATLSLKAPATPNPAGAGAAQPDNRCPVAASACVDLSNQQAWLQSAGQTSYGPVPITSGREGHRTNTGMFSVFWRDKDHLSSLFNDAPMPNSVFFDDGIAFHEGSLSDQSHGCIHLSWDASETFYDTLSVGDKVYVWGAPPY